MTRVSLRMLCPRVRLAVVRGAFFSVLLLTGACSTGGGKIAVGNDLDAERQKWRDALGQAPNDARTLAHLGVVHLKRGEAEEAVRHLSRAATLDKKSAEIAFWEGEALLAAKRPVAAVRAFQRAITLDPSRAAAFRSDAELRAYAGLADAVQANRRLLRKVLDSVATLSNDLPTRAPKTAARLAELEGDIRFSAGSTHEAMASYRRAMATGAGSAELVFKLGQAHAVLRELDQADQKFEAWVDAVPESERPARRLAVADFLEARFVFQSAVRWYERALPDAKDETAVRMRFAGVLLKAKQPERAANVLKPVLVGAKHPDTSAAVGKLYVKFNRLDEALAAYQRTIELAPHEVKYWVVVARLLKSARRDGELEATIGRPNAHLRWGRVYSELGYWEKAASRFERALTAPGAERSNAALLLGRVYHRLDRPKDRDSAFARYVKAARDRGAALRDVAAAYNELSVEDRIDPAWRAVLEENPTDKVAAFKLAARAAARRDRKTETAVIAGWANAHPAGARRADAWLTAARHWMSRRKGDDAFSAVEQVLAEGDTPLRRPALLLGATIEQRLRRNYARAESLYARWIEAAPASDRTQARKSVTERIRGMSHLRRYRVRLLESLTRELPDDASVFYSLGEIYLRVRPPQPDRARRAFERHIDLSRNRVKATLRVGQQLIRHNAFSEAARLFSRLAPSDIVEPAMHLKLARLYLRGTVSNRKRATQHVERLLAGMGKPSVSMQRDLLRLASQLENAGLHSPAVEVLTRLQRAGRSNGRVLRRLGRALLGDGQEERAVKVFDQYLKAVGGRRAVREVGDAFYERRYYRRAQEYYLRLFGKSARVQLSRLFPRLVDTYLKLGDKPGIVALAERYTTLLPNARAHADAARRLQQAGLQAEAYGYWAKAAQLQPNATHFREQQARAALALGNREAAAQAVDAMVARTRDVAVWMRAGRLLSERGFDTEALALYERALGAGVDKLELKRAQAEVFARLGRIKEVEAALDDALRGGGNIDAVLATARTVYLRRGETARYRALLQQTMTLFPERASTWLELGDLAAADGDAAAAARFWNTHVEKDPRGAIPVATRLANIGDLDSARRLLDRVVASPLSDARDRAISDLLSVLIAAGRYDALEATLDRFISATQKPEQAMAVVARGLSEQGWVVIAIKYLEVILKREPVPDGWFRLGRLHLLNGAPDKAAKAFDRYLGDTMPSPGRRRSRNPVAERLGRVRQLTLLWERFGEDDRALELLDSTVREQPDIGTLHVHRARLRLAKGDMLGALDALEALLEGRMTASLIEPSEIEALVKVLAALGRQREALNVFRRVAPEGRSFELSLALVHLALSLGESETANAEVTRVLETGSQGEVRYAMARTYFDAGMILEARELLEAVLEPGRGLAAAAPSIRLLVVIGRMQGDEGIIPYVTNLAGNVYEDRAELHRRLSEAFLEVGALDAAAEQGEAWAAAIGAIPVGDKVLTKSAPHPWRLQVTIALRQGRGEQALQVARRFIGLAERPREALVNMSRLFRQLNAWSLSRALLEDAVKADPGDRPAMLTLAELSLESGDRDGAARWIKRYLESGDRGPSSKRHVARLWVGYGYTDEAESILSTLPAIDPALDDTEFVMWIRKGNMAKAEAAALAAVDAARAPAIAAVRLAARYLRTTDIPPTLAVTLADRALALREKPPHALALLVRASAYAELGQTEAAWRDLQRSLAQGPADDVALFVPGQMLGPSRARRWSLAAFTAKALLGRQLDLVDKSTQAMVSRGAPDDYRFAAYVLREALTLRDDWTPEFMAATARTAMKLLEPLTNRPEYVIALVDALADLRERSGDLPGAIAVYREAIARFPGQSSFPNNLAYLMARRGERLEEALELVKESLARNPEGAGAYLDTMGWVLHRLGRHQQAATYVEESLRHMAGGPPAAQAESLYHLGVIYRALGRVEDARRSLYRAVRFDEKGVYGRKSANLLAEMVTAD